MGGCVSREPGAGDGGTHSYRVFDDAAEGSCGGASGNGSNGRRGVGGRPATPEEVLELIGTNGEGSTWWGSSADSSEKLPCYRVRFRPGRALDAEAVAIRALAELLWPGGQRKGSIQPRVPPAVAVWSCVGALRTLLQAQSETLLDLVVPITNVVLHAPMQEAREELWSSFVSVAVNSDSMLAHLFYWALKAATTSPQADPQRLASAQQKLKEVSAILSATTVSAGGVRGPGASPLIDMLERLHRIGEEIVAVKDKEQRLELLRRLLDEKVNRKPLGSAPVPLMLLSGNSSRRMPGSQIGAKVLHLSCKEARVLSSKERAPYLVLVELEECVMPASNGRSAGAKKSRSGLCCRRKPPKSGTEALLAEGRRPLSNGATTGASATPNCHMESAVATYLKEQDRRPKGIFKSETWGQVSERVRSSSQHGNRANWSLLPLIVKSNADDVRQEELAYRLLKWFQRVFQRHDLQLWLHPFLIVATTHDGGVLETVSNAISLSELKKGYGDKWQSLRAYFEHAFHDNHVPGEDDASKTATDFMHDVEKKAVPLSRAIRNFISSMAAYSIVCYVLAIRDRHNGNILLDDEGHIIHVDFGFMLCGAPGGRAMQQMGGFELSSGFKLTKELVEVLGDTSHKPFALFQQLVREGLRAVRHDVDELLALLQLSLLGRENSKMNCFEHPRGYPEAVLEDLCERLGLPGAGGNSGGGLSEEEFSQHIDKIVEDSVDHWRSRLYDKYQYHFTGVH